MRPFFREPLRTSLIIFAVALGVAVVLAIELAGNAAAGSFRSSMETLVGDAGLEVTAVGGVPDRVVGKLAQLPYPIAIHPRIEDYVVVANPKQTLPLIGLDLVGDASAFASAEGSQNAAEFSSDDFKSFREGSNVWVSEHLGVKTGDKLRLQVNDETHEYTVRGLLKDPDNAGNFVLMDIATAQRDLNRVDRVDRVLVNVPDSASIETWESRLKPALPGGVELRREGSQTVDNRRMLAAFRWNLRILSYVALVVGSFLIYNTISVSVVRRRAEIGIVRALGATRRRHHGGLPRRGGVFRRRWRSPRYFPRARAGLRSSRIAGANRRCALRQQQAGAHRVDTGDRYARPVRRDRSLTGIGGCAGT